MSAESILALNNMIRNYVNDGNFDDTNVQAQLHITAPLQHHYRAQPCKMLFDTFMNLVT